MDMTQIEKMTKQQLVPYIKELIDKFNEQANNYNRLYGEYQKAIEALTVASNTAVNEEVALKLQKELEDVQVELDIAKKEIKRLMEESENTIKNPESEKILETESLLKEIESLKNEIIILKAQKSPTRLSDINSLEKCSVSTYSVQTYTIYGFENRVDNSEIYGGRRFPIANILVKLENLTFTWTVDFKGSELYPAKKIIRRLTISEENLEKVKQSGKTKGMFLAIKDTFSILENFSPSTFFNSPIMVAGEEVQEEVQEVKI